MTRLVVPDADLSPLPLSSHQTTFALPDLRGRVPVGMGAGIGLSPYVIGQTAGNEGVTLSLTQIPSHVHAVDTSHVTASIACKNGGGNAQSPVGNVPAGEAAGVDADE